MIFNGKPLMRHGKPAMGTGCCCEDCACPSDCSAMGDTRTVTFTGFTGTYAAMNGVDITLSRTLCEWSASGGFYNDCYEGYNVLLSCISTEWVLQLELLSWGTPGSMSCDPICQDIYESAGQCGSEPPLGGYAMTRTVAGDGCDEATVTATLATP